MNNAGKIIVAIIAALLALWAVSVVIKAMHLILPLVIIAGIGYGVYHVATKKALPWEKRRYLP